MYILQFKVVIHSFGFPTLNWELVYLLNFKEYKNLVLKHGFNPILVPNYITETDVNLNSKTV